MNIDVKLHTKVVEQHPNIVLVYVDDKNYAAIEAIDASKMTEDEIMQWKRENPNYSSTEPYGKYFLMRIVEFQLDNPPDSDKELAKVANKFLLKGGDFWHDHYITIGN